MRSKQPGRRRIERPHGLPGAALVVLLVLSAGGVGGVLIKEGLDARSPGPHAQPLPSATFAQLPAAVLDLPLPAQLTTPQKGSIQKSCTDTGSPQVAIPSLCIFAPLVRTAFSGGQLIIPKDVHQVGYDTDSAPLDAATGTSVIAGHVDDSNQGSGSFYFLHSIAPGADIAVTSDSGAVTQWRVYAIQVVVKAQLPADIFATSGPRRLALVTCGGPLLNYAGGSTYEDNVIVYATPASGP